VHHGPAFLWGLGASEAMPFEVGSCLLLQHFRDWLFLGVSGGKRRDALWRGKLQDLQCIMGRLFLWGLGGEGHPSSCGMPVQRTG